MKTLRFDVLLVLLTLIITACAPAATPAPPPTPITVQFAWTHQSIFAGFYAADQQGFYAAEGLPVTFVEGGANVDSMTSVLDGTAQFGVTGADQVLLARSEGRPVRALATIYRRSPVVYISLADSGITRPQDFAGKTIRVTPNLIVSLHAMTTRVGIPPDQYTEVTLPSDVAAFATGEVPVWGCFIDGLAVSAQRAGVEINIIYPDDYGIHFYGYTIFTTDDLIAQNPDLVRRFLRATLQGWDYIIQNPEQDGELVAVYNPKADVALENMRMNIMLPLVNTGEDYIGWMKPEVWVEMEAALREQGVLTKPLDVTEVYTLQFLQEIYEAK